MNTENLILEQYTLKFKKTDTFDVKEYVAMFRYLLLLHKKGIVPDRISFEQDYSNLIDLESFSKNRLGLITFKLKKNVPIENLKEVQFELINDSEESRYAYAKELKSDILEPINGLALLLKLPKKTTLKFKIDFVCDNGLTHARYSSIEGFRLKTDEEGSQIVNFELVNEQIEPTLKDLAEFLKQKSLWTTTVKIIEDFATIDLLKKIDLRIKKYFALDHLNKHL